MTIRRANWFTKTDQRNLKKVFFIIAQENLERVESELHYVGTTEYAQVNLLQPF
ncbi:MAG TPA: hypothetical protein VJ184_10010 [Chryseolinea sp.]|nr:hypothetical protein [Chryseolinea sp.]